MDNPRPSPAGTMPDIGACENVKIFVDVEEKIIISTEFALYQNYPNPFNPTTTIKYSIAVRANCNSPVQIKIFDVLGNEIATLVNEEKPAGSYKVTWNAENYASGVYYYQLKAGEFTSTKKLLLLK
jgi:hypothetical protein